MKSNVQVVSCTKLIVVCTKHTLGMTQTSHVTKAMTKQVM